MEYIGLIVVVVAVIGALVASGVSTELGQAVGNKICQAVGGDCGDGDGGEASDGSAGGTSGGQGGRDGDQRSANDREPKTQAEKDYEKALKDLKAAESEFSAEEKKTVEAAKKLAKILADELGISDAVKCFTEGDPASCGETAINIVLQLVGGMPAKILKKYGWPTEWKKGAKVAKDIVKHGGDVVSGAKGMWKAKKKVDRLKKKVDDLQKKLPKREKKPEPARKPEGPKDEKVRNDRDRHPECTVPQGNHSFLAGTDVLLADGTRKDIDRVRIGDRVVTTNPNLRQTTTATVERTIRTLTDKEFTRLTVSVQGRERTLTATDTHPFWLVDEGRWRDAREVRAGAQLRTPDGGALTVTRVSHYTKKQPTYDLTVRTIHTYYVGIGHSAALVHNEGGMDGCSDAAYQGTLHMQEEMEKEAKLPRNERTHDIGIKDEDELADYLDGYANRGDGAALSDGSGVAWYDETRGCVIIQHSKQSMTAYKMTKDKFLKRTGQN